MQIDRTARATNANDAHGNHPLEVVIGWRYLVRRQSSCPSTFERNSSDHLDMVMKDD
jgi:hypothetical protein